MWRRNWFLITLVLLQVLGPVLSESILDDLLDVLSMDMLTAVILLLMSLSLETRSMQRALSRPLPVLLGLAVNLVIVPGLGLLLAGGQLIQEFMLGLVITVSVPTTMSTALVMTQRGGGNVAVTLLVVVVCNSLGVLMIPFWLQYGSGVQLELDFWEMFRRVCQIAVVPVVLGQLLQLSSEVRTWARAHRPSMSFAAQLGVLLAVFKTSVHYGQAVWNELGSGALTLSLLVLLASVVTLHLLALSSAWGIARMMGLNPEDQLAVMMSGSQKTLANAIAIANFGLFGGEVLIALLVVPPILHHLLQILIDSYLVETWRKRFARKPLPQIDAVAPLDSMKPHD